MPSFAPALDSVLGHLELARQHGRPLRASREVLAVLAAARSEVSSPSVGASSRSTEAAPRGGTESQRGGTEAAPRGGAELQLSRAPVERELAPTTKRPVERELAPTTKRPVERELAPTTKRPVERELAPTTKRPVEQELAPTTKRPVGQELAPTKAERLAALQARTSTCVKCPHLAACRRTVVFGVGNPEAELMFVGEAPGADEDRQGEPFVGKAGQLLTKVIQTMGLSRELVYIANVLKCRPDTPGQTFGNRKPTPEEMATCLPYLEEQIAIIQPKVLVALGGTAVSGLLGGELKITSLRGRWHDFRGIPLMPTFHPSFLLRPENEAKKRQTWEDMLMVKERLGLEITARERRYFLPKAGAAGE